MNDRSLIGRRLALVAIGAVLVVLAPATVAAHAELESTTPEDGATIEGTPPEIIATFDEALFEGSTIRLRNAGDETIAEGIIDPDDDTRMIITDLPELAPGEYQVRWVSKAEDGDVERDTWSFTVAAAPTPSPTASAIPSEGLTPSASAAASPSAAAPSSAPPSAVPNPSNEPGSDTSGASGGDVLLPIIVAVVIVAIGGAWLLSRRGRTGGMGGAGGAG